MNAVALLQELRNLGAEVSTDGQRINVRAPRGAITPILADAVRQHKSELLRLLETHTPPANDCHPPAKSGQWDEETRLLLVEAWRAFWREHGPALAAHGWEQADLLGGLPSDPVAPWDRVPGVAALIGNGWTLAEVNGGFLRFRLDGDAGGVLNVRGGAWLGELAAERWLERFEERAAILQYDGGMSRLDAERQAASELTSV